MARKHPTRLIVLVVALTLGAACVAKFPDPHPAPEGVRAVISESGACPAEESIALGEKPAAGSLTGDVNGDSLEDEVYIAADRNALPGCKSFLIVVSDTVPYSTPVDPSGVPRSLETPSLSSLADVDGEPGLEIVVNIEMGASTQFVGLFTLTDQGLEPMTLTGKGPGPFAGELDDLFPFGGSVGHLEAVDCLDGYVVMSAAIPAGDSADAYEVERRYFSPEANELVLDKSLTKKLTVEGLKIGDFPEFAGSPFGSCD